MRLAYVGLSIALVLYIIAQGVNRPVFYYALALPGIMLMYGLLAQEILPEVIEDDEEINAGHNDE
jgi:hypothetical protein